MNSLGHPATGRSLSPRRWCAAPRSLGAAQRMKTRGGAPRDPRAATERGAALRVPVLRRLGSELGPGARGGRRRPAPASGVLRAARLRSLRLNHHPDLPEAWDLQRGRGADPRRGRGRGDQLRPWAADDLGVPERGQAAHRLWRGHAAGGRRAGAGHAGAALAAGDAPVLGAVARPVVIRWLRHLLPGGAPGVGAGHEPRVQHHLGVPAGARAEHRERVRRVLLA